MRLGRGRLTALDVQEMVVLISSDPMQKKAKLTDTVMNMNWNPIQSNQAQIKTNVKPVISHGNGRSLQLTHKSVLLKFIQNHLQNQNV